MIINLPASFVAGFTEAHKAKFPVLCKKATDKINRYGETHAELDTGPKGLREYDEGLTEDALLDLVYEHAKAGKYQGIMMAISSVRTMMKDHKSKPPGSLGALEEGLNRFFLKDAVDGWLYKKGPDDKMLAYVVREVYYQRYTPRQKEDGYKDYVMLSFTANSTSSTVSRSRESGKSSEQYSSLRWEWGEFNKKTVPQLLAEKGIYHETAELKEDYLRQLGLYDVYRPMYGKQFTAAPGSRELEEDEYKESLSSRSLAAPTKYINDDAAVKRSFSDTRSATYWQLQGAPEGLFSDMPVHPYLRMFNLESHEFAFVHVDHVRPYKFDKTLADKIVLPPEHRDLIEVLVQDLDSVSGDVVKGKTGGVCVLCKGAAGLGKTLTAEIYSEVSEKALYRVHSGQLGTDAEDVEKALKTIFQRAQQWDCILLLDEADVYIRRRGDDLMHNAVVASFLRTMEYFGGVFFMTTNREDDVDDAIVSRCIAVILYKLPTAEAAGRIFGIQSQALGSDLAPGEIEKLVKLYGGKISGRDIKELLKLATRYARGKGHEAVTSETVRKLAQFKGF